MAEWLTANWRIGVILVIAAAGLLWLWRRTATANGIAGGSSFSATEAASLTIAAIFIITLSEPRVLSYAMPALLIIVSIGIFVLLLVHAASSLKSDGITDATQPFGLPAGSIRAILTLSFVVLIGVFGSFVLSQSNGRSGLVPVEGLDGKLIEAGTLADFKDSLGPNFVVAAEVVTGDAKSVRVTVMSKADYATADDIAKQILNMLMTLVAAMIGFYFGAKIDGDGAQRDGTMKATRAGLMDQVARAKSSAAAARKTISDARATHKGTGKEIEIELEAKKIEELSNKLDEASSNAQRLIDNKSGDETALKKAYEETALAEDGLAKALADFKKKAGN